MKKSLGAKTFGLPAPVWVVGVYDGEGRPNAMTASWAGQCCSRPPCINVALRSATYTHHCILGRRAFTISIPSVDHAALADYLGMASGRAEDKFAKTGLTAVRSKVVDAPYIEEFPLVLECSLFRVVELGLHTLFVGEILDTKVEEAALDERGRADILRIEPFVYSPANRAYYRVGETAGRAFSIGKTIGEIGE